MTPNLGPAGQCAARPGPLQFTLRGLFFVTTVTAAFAAAGSGAFGVLAQALALVLLLYLVGFSATAGFAIFMVILAEVFCGLPIRLWQWCCGRRNKREKNAPSPSSG